MNTGGRTEHAAIDGLVLAGGRALRFGSDKRLAWLWGRPLIVHAVRMVRGAVGRGALFVATGPRRERLPYLGSVIVIADQPPGHGPLGGIAAGLARVRVGVVVVACDVPALRAQTLERVMAAGRCADRPAALFGPRGWEPLIAYYPRWVLHHARAALSHGVWAPHLLLERLGAVRVPALDPGELANVNWPGDLAMLEERSANPAVQPWARKRKHLPKS